MAAHHRQCAHCGSDFTFETKSGPGPKYCSIKCKRQLHAKKTYAPRSPVSFPQCSVCGDVFCSRSRASYARHTCTKDSCRRATRARQQREWKAQYRSDHGHGYPRHREPTPGVARGQAHHRWLSDDITYDGAHARVVRLHGVASEHTCTDCPNQAQDWSYDGADVNEKTDDLGRPYSTDPAHYAPRCRSCHKTFDSSNMAVLA